jgi:DNA-binding transcriptional ArsR family regulator
MALNQQTMEVGRKPLKERTRRPVDALPHSVNHWIRVEALAIFHEGEFCAGEVADMIGEDVKNVSGHIRDLYDSGCIEFAGYKMVGNYRKPVYRAIVRPVVTDEVYRAMSIEDRHDLNLCLLWNALNLDAEGQRELLAYLITTWKGVQGIHARAVNRMAESGEIGTSTVVGLLGFERGRPGRPGGGYFGAGKNER